MVLNVLWQIGTRFVLGDPSSWTEELARFMLIWLALLGGVYTFRRGSNIGFDLVTANLSGPLKKATEVFGLLVVLTFAAAAMCFGGFQLVALTLDLGQTSASLGVPMGAVYSIIPISGAFIGLYAVEELVQRLLHPTTGIQE